MTVTLTRSDKDGNPLEFSVLGQGYCYLVEGWGTDEAIVEAARMSTGKGFRSWYPYLECTHPGCDVWWFSDSDSSGMSHKELDNRTCCHSAPVRYARVGDEGLLEFLWSKQHTTPFEMGGMIVEVQAPIMVFREWHRHRTQSYNEASARYAPLPAIDYIPTVERVMRGTNTRNKQAQALEGSLELTTERATLWLRDLDKLYAQSQAAYQYGLRLGVPKELARLCLTVGRFSKMRASANLLNWLRFLRLRYAPDAQYEIMVYADAVRQLLTGRFPRVMSLVNLPQVS